jgi:hypothetical protein
MRKIACICMMILSILACFSTIVAQEKPSEEQVKAAFLYNFAKFTEWPASAFKNKTSDFVIGVLQNDNFAGKLTDLVKNKQVQGRAIKITIDDSPENLKGCHIVYTGTISSPLLESTLSTFDKLPILTVGDASGFVQLGGIIRFFPLDEKIRFEINAEKANSAGIRISSKLLKLATPFKAQIGEH